MLREGNMSKFFYLIIFFFPSVASANVVWPALELTGSLLWWWPIAVGLVVEFAFIKWLFPISFIKAVIAVISANITSTIAGIILIPLAGIVWELFPGSIIYWVFGWGTFNPVGWAATLFLACFVNGFIERFVYIKWFVPVFKIKSMGFLWLLIANSVSVGIAYQSYYPF